MFERKVTHLLRCRKICNPHNLQGCSGCKFFCALHLGNFSSKHGSLFRHCVDGGPGAEISSPTSHIPSPIPQLKKGGPAKSRPFVYQWLFRLVFSSDPRQSDQAGAQEKSCAGYGYSGFSIGTDTGKDINGFIGVIFIGKG